MNTDQPTQPLERLRIWQQNLNTSTIAQLTLLNSTPPADWDILALQEPAINKLGNTRANPHWRVVYPTLKYSDGRKSRAVTLINTRISTNTWKQLDFPSADVVIIQLVTSQGLCTIINTYNDGKNEVTIEALDLFLTRKIRTIRPNDTDHIIWLRDFNRHHPLWDEE